LYDDDSELAFENVPAGPFAGKDAIAAAYRADPPDDEIRITETREDDAVIEARFAWSRGGTGRMRLERDGERIRRLTVTFD
jgi:steroid delta-isomerase